MFAPEADYKRHGDVQDINLYYRAADSSIALAHGSIRALLSRLDGSAHSEHSNDRRHARPDSLFMEHRQKRKARL
jgi:hypothetical protein